MGSYFEFGLKHSITFMCPNFSLNLCKNEASFHNYSFHRRGGGGGKASIVLHIVATISPFEFLIMIHYFSSNQLN